MGRITRENFKVPAIFSSVRARVGHNFSTLEDRVNTVDSRTKGRIPKAVDHAVLLRGQARGNLLVVCGTRKPKGQQMAQQRKRNQEHRPDQRCPFVQDSGRRKSQGDTHVIQGPAWGNVNATSGTICPHSVGTMKKCYATQRRAPVLVSDTLQCIESFAGAAVASHVPSEARSRRITL